MILPASGTSGAVLTGLTLVCWPIAPVADTVIAATANAAFATNNFNRRTLVTYLRVVLSPVTFGEYDCAQMRTAKIPVASGAGTGGPGKPDRHFPVAKFPASSVRCPY